MSLATLPERLCPACLYVTQPSWGHHHRSIPDSELQWGRNPSHRETAPPSPCRLARDGLQGYTCPAQPTQEGSAGSSPLHTYIRYLGGHLHEGDELRTFLLMSSNISLSTALPQCQAALQRSAQPLWKIQPRNIWNRTGFPINAFTYLGSSQEERFSAK